jgi:periplasmic protein TonB
VNNEMDDQDQSQGSKYLAPFIWAVVFTVLLVLAYFIGKTLMGKGGASKPTLKQLTMVKILTPPPPPPPPPKPPEKLPDPPKQEVKIEQPKPQETPKTPDEPPPQAKLGVDAEASGEGDGFGLGANKGGRDLVQGGAGTGTGTGGTIASVSTATTSRIQYTFYRDVIVRHVNELLMKIPEFRDQDASIPVAIWVGKNGRIEKIDFSASNLSAERIDLLRNALMNGPTLRQLPPDNMPQPLRVRVKVQEAG